VVTLTPARLAAIDGPDFVAAVAANDTSQLEADRFVNQRR
jgi:hypothetical protein